MQPDYPAAHSMDTYWFAVDSEGQIGFFETGEPGPVPINARSDEGGHEWLKHLFFATPTMVLLNAPCEGSVHAREDYDGTIREQAIGYFAGTNLCMLLRSKQHLSELGKVVEVGPEIVTPEATVHAVYVSRINEKAYQAVHEAGMCLGCVGLWGLGESRCEQLGIYHYEPRGNYDHGPYVRVGMPHKPLVISQLSAEAQSLIMAFPLPIRFDGEEHVQPLELVPCRTWGTGDEYLASDLKTMRPVPER